MAFEFAPYHDVGAGKRVMGEAQYEALVAGYSPDGIFGHPGDPNPLAIVGGQLVLRAGVSGVARGYWWSSGDTDTPITVGSNAGGTGVRRDHIVIRIDRDANPRTVAPVARQGGTNGLLPAPAQALGSTGQWELSLGSVALPAGGTIGAATLTRLGWYVGPDGQLLCTSSTRPPPSPGRVIYETNTGRQLLANGEQWRLVTDAEASAAVTLVAANWTAPLFNQLYRRNGSVDLTLTPQRVSGPLNPGTSSTLGTIPTGFRPVGDKEITGHVVSTGALVVCRIVGSTGVITLTPWRDRIESARYVNLQAASWPVRH
ncbi:hypothetical protein D0Q02_07670 [Micromonospora craniellae]|uniref:Uncharacterized protein n=2 Tax=Micromonospora craniellae TaxID=2294034 RepID=A0A372G1V8_9ACTN|nr:hypothetical protein D0Q02_07670 [Micromonospora craniellae]